MREYWQAAGFKIKTIDQAGMKGETPDAYVVRVSLLGVDSDDFEAMIKKMKRSKVNEIRKQVAMCEDKYRKRFQAESAEAADRKSISFSFT